MTTPHDPPPVEYPPALSPSTRPRNLWPAAALAMFTVGVIGVCVLAALKALPWQ